MNIWNRVSTGVVARITRNWMLRPVVNRCDTAFVSFSFDDFPHSAAQEGGAILARHSVKGTYFVSGARVGQRVDGLDHFTMDDLSDIAGAGHEIGCHTFSHKRLSGAHRTEIEKDLARNREFIASAIGERRLTSFAYPYGDVSIRAKSILAENFPVCRGIDWGINRRLIDFGQLKAVILSRALQRKRISKILDIAQETNAWVIFFTHDVSDAPSLHGCRPAQLAGIVQEVVDRGINVLPVRSVAEQIFASAAADGPAVFQPRDGVPESIGTQYL